MTTSHAGCDHPLSDTSSNGTLNDSGNGIHRSDNLGLELRWDMEFDLLEKIFGCTKTTNHEDILECSVLCLNGNDLISDQLQDAIHHGLEALQNLLVGEGHVSFFDTSFWEFCLDTNIHSPLLVVVPEIGLDSILKIHNTLCVNSAGSF